MGRVMEPFNPNERLLERILSKENVARAWKRVKANHGAPGVDGITIEQFPDRTRDLWAGIRQSLLAGTYQPLPVKAAFLGVTFRGTKIHWSQTGMTNQWLKDQGFYLSKSCG